MSYKRTAGQHLRAHSQPILQGGSKGKPTRVGKTPWRKHHPDSKSSWLLSEIKTEQHFNLTYGIVFGHQLCADLREHDLASGGEHSAVTCSPQTHITLALWYEGGGSEELAFQTRNTWYMLQGHSGQGGSECALLSLHT